MSAKESCQCFDTVWKLLQVAKPVHSGPSRAILLQEIIPLVAANCTWFEAFVWTRMTTELCREMKMGFHWSRMLFILASDVNAKQLVVLSDPTAFLVGAHTCLPFSDQHLFVDKLGPVLKWYQAVFHGNSWKKVIYHSRFIFRKYQIITACIPNGNIAAICYFKILNLCILTVHSFITGLLGPTALSLNTSTTPNSLLNALNSSVSPLQSPSSGTPSPTLWAPPLANTSSATGQYHLSTIKGMSL